MASFQADLARTSADQNSRITGSYSGACSPALVLRAPDTFPPVRKEYSLAASFSYDDGDGYNWVIANLFRRSSKSKRASTMLDVIYDPRDDDPPGTPAGTFSHESDKDQWRLARASAQNIVEHRCSIHNNNTLLTFLYGFLYRELTRMTDLFHHPAAHQRSSSFHLPLYLEYF